MTGILKSAAFHSLSHAQNVLELLDDLFHRAAAADEPTGVHLQLQERGCKKRDERLAVYLPESTTQMPHPLFFCSCRAELRAQACPGHASTGA